MIYFDCASTTKPCDAALAAFAGASWGNPSSLHSLGLEAQRQLNAARREIASSIGARPDEVFFTSTGTESNNTAIYGAASLLHARGRRIITTDSEHPSVLEPYAKLKQEGFDVVLLPTKGGVLSLEALGNAIDAQTILVSCMMVNNETGAVNPIEAISRIIADKTPYGRKILFHTDAVQAYMKMPVNVKKLGADMLSLSGHKVQSLKGAAALFVAKGTNLPSLMQGGGQESKLRSGTQNTPAAYALGESVKAQLPSLAADLAAAEQLCAYTADQITAKIEGASVNLPPEHSPYILSATIPGIRSEIMLQYLSGKDIYISSGSACSAKSGDVSHVLSAYGMTQKQADCTVRISFGKNSTKAQADELVAAMAEGTRTLVRVKVV